MYSGTRVCAGHAHWQSTTLWKYRGLRISVGCTPRLLPSAGASDLPASPVEPSLAVSPKTGRGGAARQKKTGLVARFSDVIPAQAGTHFPDDEGQMDPGVRRDDGKGDSADS